MKRMLINATNDDEIRVAIVNNKILIDLDSEIKERTQKKASIYKGRVIRVEPSLGAAFIAYGSERQGFLSIKEVAREYFSDPNLAESARPNIKDALKPGQEIIVQVVKEERGTKGAALTTFISLAGPRLVLMAKNPRAGGISRQIEGDDRSELKNILSQLTVPEGMGLIVRTNGLGHNIEELQRDLDNLLTQWQAILQVASERSAPFLIHSENDVIVRALRDSLRTDIEEIVVDTQAAFEHVKKNILWTRADFVDKITLYQAAIPLFNAYQIEKQIESIFTQEISLENGASIVINNTEALTAIDVNSAKATDGHNIEETALQSNLAAAREIAKQVRLRDTGGLIVIDFIDMDSPRHQRMVENELREEIKTDRARMQLGRISRFGLLEMNRQRLRPGFGDINQVRCHTCRGQGVIRTIPSLASTVLRVLEDEAMREGTQQLNVHMHLDLATYLLNEKRESLVALEKRHHIRILLLPNPHSHYGHYEIIRVRDDNSELHDLPSYKCVSAPLPSEVEALMSKAKETEPALKSFALTTPPNTSAKEENIIKRLWKAMFSSPTNERTTTKESADQGQTSETGLHSWQHDKNGRGRRDRNGPSRNNMPNNRRRPSNNRSRNEPLSKEQEELSTIPAAPNLAPDVVNDAGVKTQQRKPRNNNPRQPRNAGGNRKENSLPREQQDEAAGQAQTQNHPQTQSQQTQPQSPREPRTQQPAHQGSSRQAPQANTAIAAVQQHIAAAPVMREKAAPPVAVRAEKIIEEKTVTATPPAAAPVTPTPKVKTAPSFLPLTEEKAKAALVTFDETDHLHHQNKAADNLSQIKTVPGKAVPIVKTTQPVMSVEIVKLDD